MSLRIGQIYCKLNSFLSTHTTYPLWGTGSKMQKMPSGCSKTTPFRKHAWEQKWLIKRFHNNKHFQEIITFGRTTVWSVIKHADKDWFGVQDWLKNTCALYPSRKKRKKRPIKIKAAFEAGPPLADAMPGANLVAGTFFNPLHNKLFEM